MTDLEQASAAWYTAISTEATVHDLIASLRGDWPEACDFCKKPYTKERFPVPEEAGAWACSECVKRWEAEEPK